MTGTSSHARGVALLVAGVLIFADDPAPAVVGAAVTIGMLVTIGFADGRLRAVLWAVVLVASAFLADVLWQLGWEPFDRADQYEAIPQTPYVMITLPAPMAVIAIGVGVGALWRRSH